MKWKSVKDSKPKDGSLVYGCNEKIVPGFLCHYHEWADCFYPRDYATVIMPLAVTHWIALPTTIAMRELGNRKMKLLKEKPVMTVQFCKPNEEQKDPKKRGRKPKRMKA